MAKRASSAPPRRGPLTKNVKPQVASRKEDPADLPTRTQKDLHPFDPTKKGGFDKETPYADRHPSKDDKAGRKKRGVPFVKAYANGLHVRGEAAKDVYLTKMDKFTHKLGYPGFKSTTITVDGKSRPRRHKQFMCVKDYTPGRKFVASQSVYCSCDCEDFKWRLEVAFAMRGAAPIIYSNGEPAYLTNPKNIVFFCKHLLQLGNEIRKRRYVG